jgi:hypothetical protein
MYAWVNDVDHRQSFNNVRANIMAMTKELVMFSTIKRNNLRNNDRIIAIFLNFTVSIYNDGIPAQSNTVYERYRDMIIQYH